MKFAAEILTSNYTFKAWNLDICDSNCVTSIVYVLSCAPVSCLKFSP